MNERLITILKKFTTAEFISPESQLKMDLELDSVQMISIVVEIEEEFDISIDDDKIYKLFTVSDILALLNEAEISGDDKEI